MKKTLAHNHKSQWRQWRWRRRLPRCRECKQYHVLLKDQLCEKCGKWEYQECLKVR